jgi:CheY-like chemotaxis protein
MHESEAGSGPPRRTPAVLVAEDDAALRALLEVVLAREGYEVVACGDGEAAGRALASAAAGRTSLDIALLDLRMPGVSGTDLLRAIRGDSRLRGMRAVAMSGYSDAQQAEQAREAGADAFLPKPFAIDELTSLLRRLLDG